MLTAAQPQQTRTRVRHPSLVGVYLLLIVYALLVAYPLLWMLLSSFKSTQDIYQRSWSLPQEWHFENYLTAWNQGISDYFLNSVIVTGSTIALTLLLGSLCAYGLSRFDFRYSNALLLLCIGGMLVSPQVSLVPLFKMMQALHIHDTFLAMILPYVAYRLPMTVLLVRSFFLSIPRELDEAAYIDGCTPLQIFWRIYLPLSRSILLTAAVLTAYYAWNEFLFAIIFIDSDHLKTIPAGLMNFRDALSTNWGVLLAGLVIAALPIIVLFLSMQKYFLSGMTAGSVKG
ncbi:raffinose/stachyose/melibiose transport system permease protein [Deinobacterium chartae]|uniref:Raffinose/stachyose/melibiose transport system permease protein n=1 Tax=Deinobacterium chartae TaxID=521158 RepID=A0A841HXU4_9DEIO|nr:carbohydrate ABC transporter permease [Deinobacterium chartae]MBB6098361.1 raffinose/stachyose/melibiose transport system permease protein [Deinobacterium chartae]